MSPDSFSVWIRILRDVAIVLVATFMLVHETISADPNPVVIGAALAMFGVPAALRLDARKGSNGD